MQVDGDRREKEIYSADGLRRIAIFRRETGTVYYEQEHFSEYPDELCWLPYSQMPIGIYETADKAEIEARANTDWLADSPEPQD